MVLIAIDYEYSVELWNEVLIVWGHELVGMIA